MNLRPILLFALLGLAAVSAPAQLSGTALTGPPDPPPMSAPAVETRSQAEVDRASAGTAPADPGPLATDVSGKLNSADIRKAMRKVADWQLRAAQPLFNRQWTFAALYDGLLAASATTGDPRYREAVAAAAADKFHWQLIQSRFPHADDEAVGKSYLALYELAPDPVKIADTRATMDRLIARPDDPKKNLWWWCDALYMAPPVLARLSKATGDPRYLAFMDHEWSLTTAELYDPQQRLFSRDAGYLQKTEANGQKLFWARGNGWVLAGLVQVLSAMPADYPGRARYEQQFRDIARRVAGLQQPDGLWRTGLLDQQAYKEPEVSGTAFYAYAMAWGINTGRLPSAEFLPVVTRAWAGMVAHIYADGRLGAIQRIGAAPDSVGASSSYVYGVGGFLLAGSELDRMVNAKPGAKRP